MRLLQRFGDHDMDQFAHWRLPTRSGDVFVSVTRHPATGASVEAYTDLTTLASDGDETDTSGC